MPWGAAGDRRTMSNDITVDRNLQQVGTPLQQEAIALQRVGITLQREAIALQQAGITLQREAIAL